VINISKGNDRLQKKEFSRSNLFQYYVPLIFVTGSFGSEVGSCQTIFIAVSAIIMIKKIK